MGDNTCDSNIVRATLTLVMWKPVRFDGVGDDVEEEMNAPILL